MVALDPAVLRDNRQSLPPTPERAGGDADARRSQGLRGTQGTRSHNEGVYLATEGHGEGHGEDRAERVRRLAQLVRGGAYLVPADRLAQALLEWDPRHTVVAHQANATERRRTYMREYMRRRRAIQDEQQAFAEQE